jgi:O-acetyl-ADP-ribose deacetylase (regulator of RNase III)
MRDAARIAVQAVKDAELAPDLAEVRFVLFSDDAYAAFADALADTSAG